MRPVASVNRILRVLARALLLALLWWALTGGQPSGLLFGAVLVLAVTALSVRSIAPVGTLRFSALPAFLIFFLSEMFKGGLDVARRALHPRLPIRPDFRIFLFRSHGRGQQVLLAWTAGLLPGTVSVELGDGELEIHVLDDRMPVEETLRRLERRIDALLPAADDY